VAYDEDLAVRVRDLLAEEPEVEEKRMFGGLAFLLGGNMAVAVSGKGGLMVRVDPDETETLLAEPGAVPFEMRGRPLDGWLRVDGDALADDGVLRSWVDRGTAYAKSLPAK
jgi:TfoX/Sxy family transcriptional regulator of competence genes